MSDICLEAVCFNANMINLKIPCVNTINLKIPCVVVNKIYLKIPCVNMMNLKIPCIVVNMIFLYFEGNRSVQENIYLIEDYDTWTRRKNCGHLDY